MKMKRLAGLDSLRGIAALGVVTYHFTSAYQAFGPQPALHKVLFTFPYGQYGVELFFIISGFVIFMTLEKTKHIYDFFASRFARLYPAYIAALLTTIVICRFLDYQPYTYRFIDSHLLAKNLTMMPGLFGSTGIDGSYWSLLYELVFYFWAAITVFWIGPRRPEIPCLVWLATSLLVRAIGVRTFPEFVAQLTVAQFSHLFVIGIMLFQVHARRATAMTYALLAGALAISLLGPYWSLQPIDRTVYAGIIAGFTFLVWLSASGYAGVLEWRPLPYLGRISYPLYLIHQMAGFAIISKLNGLGLNPNCSILIAVATVILLASAISNYIEWPANYGLRALFARNRERFVRAPT